MLDPIDHCQRTPFPLFSKSTSRSWGLERQSKWVEKYGLIWASPPSPPNPHDTWTQEGSQGHWGFPWCASKQFRYCRQPSQHVQSSPLELLLSPPFLVRIRGGDLGGSPGRQCTNTRNGTPHRSPMKMGNPSKGTSKMV